MLWVQDPDGTAVHEERRIRRLQDMIHQGAGGGAAARPSKAASAASAARCLHRCAAGLHRPGRPAFTVIEVNGLDRPGLVHALARALFHLGLTIGSAHLTTYGERAVDVFYVKDVIGHKVTNANRKKAVERHLLEALAGPMKKARPAKRRREDAAARPVGLDEPRHSAAAIGGTTDRRMLGASASPGGGDRGWSVADACFVFHLNMFHRLRRRLQLGLHALPAPRRRETPRGLRRALSVFSLPCPPHHRGRACHARLMLVFIPGFFRGPQKFD